jgi:hypothetical protein
LVRKKNGLATFRSFLESYRRFAAGIAHKLLIIYKGFSGPSDLAPYEAQLVDITHDWILVADFGFDLRPYFVAAEKSDCDYVCFLNSFSVILAEHWLLKLYQHISTPGIGIVGATGSWSSIGTGKIRRQRPTWKRLLRPLVWPARRWYFRTYFDGFPNPHIRTNAFMIARLAFLRIRRGMLLTKMQMYRLEGGKQSITRQVERMGLEPVVVDKNGKGYVKHDWNRSGTFWRGNQENLLISDNQTRKYDYGDQTERLWLEDYAWGDVRPSSSEPLANA